MRDFYVKREFGQSPNNDRRAQVSELKLKNSLYYLTTFSQMQFVVTKQVRLIANLVWIFNLFASCTLPAVRVQYMQGTAFYSRAMYQSFAYVQNIYKSGTARRQYRRDFTAKIRELCLKLVCIPLFHWN